jgi:hypothetical protein
MRSWKGTPIPIARQIIDGGNRGAGVPGAAHDEGSRIVPMLARQSDRLVYEGLQASAGHRPLPCSPLSMCTEIAGRRAVWSPERSVRSRDRVQPVQAEPLARRDDAKLGQMAAKSVNCAGPASERGGCCLRNDGSAALAQLPRVTVTMPLRRRRTFEELLRSAKWAREAQLVATQARLVPETSARDLEDVW